MMFIWNVGTRITCHAASHGKTEHGIFVKFKKTSKTVVVLIAGVTISGTPCPRHIIVPFVAEASSGHVTQAWAIPPTSRGLLFQWHRQQTTTPETNEASPARTQQYSRHDHSFPVYRLSLINPLTLGRPGGGGYPPPPCRFSPLRLIM